MHFQGRHLKQVSIPSDNFAKLTVYTDATQDSMVANVSKHSHSPYSIILLFAFFFQFWDYYCFYLNLLLEINYYTSH